MGGDHLLPARGAGRMQWMDALRGAAIVLVLLWHAPAIPALFGWQMPEWLRAANNAFLPFRMPTLMFLSGLLLPRALSRGVRSYLIGKVQMLVWPYVLWCLLYFAQYGAPAPLYVWRVWYATGYLWFLCFITIYYILAPALTRVIPMWLIPWLCMAGSMAVHTSVEVRLFYFAAFFFFGYWFAREPRLLAALLRPRAVTALAAVAVVWGGVSATLGLEVAFRAEFSLFSMCGVLTLCWLADHLRGRALEVLAFIGRNSLVYYVAHFPVMSAIVLSCMALGWEMGPLIWLPNLVVAFVACTLLALHRTSPWVSWMFTMPEVLIRWARHPRPVTSAASARLGEGSDVRRPHGRDGA